MKEYIKPEAELIEYSFDDIIAGSRDGEGGLGDGSAGSAGGAGFSNGSGGYGGFFS